MRNKSLLGGMGFGVLIVGLIALIASLTGNHAPTGTTSQSSENNSFTLNRGVVPGTPGWVVDAESRLQKATHQSSPGLWIGQFPNATMPTWLVLDPTVQNHRLWWGWASSSSPAVTWNSVPVPLPRASANWDQLPAPLYQLLHEALQVTAAPAVPTGVPTGTTIPPSDLPRLPSLTGPLGWSAQSSAISSGGPTVLTVHLVWTYRPTPESAPVPVILSAAINPDGEVSLPPAQAYPGHAVTQWLSPSSTGPSPRAQ